MTGHAILPPKDIDIYMLVNVTTMKLYYTKSIPYHPDEVNSFDVPSGMTWIEAIRKISPQNPDGWVILDHLNRATKDSPINIPGDYALDVNGGCRGPFVSIRVV